MANQRSSIELALEVSGTTAVDGLSKSTANLKGLIGEAALSFGRGEIAADEFEATVRKLGSQLSREEKLLGQLRAAQDEAARSAAAMAAAVDSAGDTVAIATDHAATGVTKLDKAAGGLKTSGRDGSFALIELSRGVQDFQAAGFVGISNNIEGLVTSVGKLATSGASLTSVLVSPAGLIGGLTLMTTVGLAAGPAIGRTYESIVNGSNAVPVATEKIDRLNDALAKSTERLDELKKQQSLTNQELAEFNKLTERQAELAKASAAEKERLARKAKVDRLEDPVTAEAAKARAESLQDSLGGEQDAIRKAMRLSASLEPNAEVDAARKKVDEEYAEKFRLQQAAPFNRFLQAKQGRAVEAAEKKLREAEAQRDQEADQVVEKAFIDGDLESFTALRKAANKRPVDFGKGTVAALENASPEQVAADAEFERENLRAIEKRKERDKEAQAAARQAKEQAKDQAKAREDAAKADAKAREDAAKEAEKATKAVADGLSANTNLDERAAVAAAEARARGGFVDPVKGRFVKADQATQRDALAQDLASEAQRADPSLGPAEANRTGAEMARRAFEAVDAQTQGNAQALNLSNRGLSAAQSTQQAAFQTLLAVQAVLQRVQALEAGNAVLARQAGGLQRDAVGVRPPFQPRVPVR